MLPRDSKDRERREGGKKGQEVKKLNWKVKVQESILFLKQIEQLKRLCCLAVYGAICKPFFNSIYQVWTERALHQSTCNNCSTAWYSTFDTTASVVVRVHDSVRDSRHLQSPSSPPERHLLEQSVRVRP